MLKLLVLLAVVALPAMAFAKNTTTVLKVEGWGCEGCSSATEAALKKLDGVTSVKTDLKAGTATVTYEDTKVRMADLEKAVEGAGYKVVK